MACSMLDNRLGARKQAHSRIDRRERRKGNDEIIEFFSSGFFAVGAFGIASNQIDLNDDAYNSDVLEHADFDFKDDPAYDDDVLEHV